MSTTTLSEQDIALFIVPPEGETVHTLINRVYAEKLKNHKNLEFGFNQDLNLIYMFGEMIEMMRAKTILSFMEYDARLCTLGEIRQPPQQNTVHQDAADIEEIDSDEPVLVIAPDAFFLPDTNGEFFAPETEAYVSDIITTCIVENNLNGCWDMSGRLMIFTGDQQDMQNAVNSIDLAHLVACIAPSYKDAIKELENTIESDDYAPPQKNNTLNLDHEKDRILAIYPISEREMSIAKQVATADRDEVYAMFMEAARDYIPNIEEELGLHAHDILEANGLQQVSSFEFGIFLAGSIEQVEKALEFVQSPFCAKIITPEEFIEQCESRAEFPPTYGTH